MRLLDQIALGAASGGAGEAAARIVRTAALRYIVDGSASRQCFDLVRADIGLLDPDNPLLRMPAETFWIEWLCEAGPSDPANHRLGALVEAAPDGRSGVITPFWQQRDREAAAAHVRIAFDLDHHLHPAIGLGQARQMRHGSLPHLDRLFGHMLVQIDPVWAGHLRLTDPLGAERALQAEAEAVWFNLPFIIAFSVLLASRDAVEQQPADLARLNRARTKRGRTPLLDHIEVRLKLTHPEARTAGSAGQHGPREAPRLHFVRGHPVQRGSTKFWRAPHLRGDADRPITTKTVRVSG